MHASGIRSAQQRVRGTAVTRRLTVSAALAASGLIPFEAKILLGHVLDRDRAWLAAHRSTGIAAEQAQAFEEIARRRRDGEPVAYLTGRREFHDLDLLVTPDVLIPRPETELLVELALSRIALDDALRVLDLGTGSGAVALAIAKQRPRASVLGVDVSRAAVLLATRNAARLDIGNVSFVESDWFAALHGQRFDLIVSNPPYVAANDPHLSEGDLRFEPPGALLGGVDGLAAMRAIVSAASAHLTESGWLMLEHGYDQAAGVQQLLDDAGFVEVAATRDLAGILRVTYARVAGSSLAPG